VAQIRSIPLVRKNLGASVSILPVVHVRAAFSKRTAAHTGALISTLPIFGLLWETPYPICLAWPNCTFELSLIPVVGCDGIIIYPGYCSL
jgi:hypothetical protein